MPSFKSIERDGEPEAALPVHTVDIYKVILLENVQVILHKAIQNIK